MEGREVAYKRAHELMGRFGCDGVQTSRIYASDSGGLVHGL